MRGVALRWSIIIGVLFACFFLVGITSANAQVCFRGKPPPTCKGFWVTELGLGYRVNGPQRGWPVSEIGLMFNVNERYAIGGTSYVAYDAQYDDFRGGLKLRVRRWLNPDVSLNVSGGLILLGGDYREKYPEFTGHVDVNYKDLLAPYVGLDLLRIEQGSLDGAGWHLGIRFGSYAGSGLSAVALALIGLWFVGRGLAP